MQILHKVEHDDGFVCECCDCPNMADYYVTDWDGEEGYICHKCNEEDEAESSVQCAQCRDTGEKVIKRGDDYTIIFCNCTTGKNAAAEQSEALSDHGA